MTGKGQQNAGKRVRVLIGPDDSSRILSGLEAWGAQGSFVALRTRALVHLLWDGAVRTTAALALNAQDVTNVIDDSDSPQPRVLREVWSDDLGRRFFLSPRCRDSISAYLRLVHREGWLPTAKLEGPLFIGRQHRGAGRRLSARSAIHSWKLFQSRRLELSRAYGLDDVVLSGRKAFMCAANGNADLLADHSGISYEQAATYRDESMRNNDAGHVLEMMHVNASDDTRAEGSAT